MNFQIMIETNDIYAEFIHIFLLINDHSNCKWQSSLWNSRAELHALI